MQHRILSSLILLGISLLIIQPKAKAGNPDKLSFENRSFIENKGQFDGRIGKYSDKIEYAVDFGALQIYFTQEGVYYAMYQTPKNYKRKKGQKGVPRMLVKSDLLQILFLNKSDDVKIVTTEMTPDYHTYPVKNMDGSFEDVNFIRGFKKLTYSNLYPGIDLEYVFDPRGGLKYSFKIKAGSNPNKIKFQFSGNRLLQLDSDGNLLVETPFGNITDHKPLTYYSNNSNQIIESSFQLKDNQLSFQLGNYDLNRDIIIDPWTVTPNSFSNSNKVFEIETDQNSNIYVYGGDSPFRLKKYDSGGNLQWTYNTPWDTSGYWVGTLKTDLVGNSYITSGTSGTLRKINTGGTMDWTNANTGPIPEIEFWSLTFNCDYSKLYCGGMRSANGINIAGYRGTIFDMSLVNGAVTAFNNVGFNTGGLIPNIKEVRSISYSPNGKIYYLTLDSIGCLNSSFIQTFQNPSALDFTYGIPDYGVTNQGIHAIAAGTNFIYTNNGNTVQKRSIANGAVITSVTIPGGISTTVPFIGGNTPGNSGIVLDSCGSIYVGSGNGVYKFDANLNQTASFTTPAAVYDVAINYNGEIVACGNNFIVSIANFSPCFPPAPVCLNCLELTPAGPFCVTSPATTFTANSSGGTWTGPGITNGNTGAFNPSIAGVGTHVIHYTLNNPLPCGLDSMTVIVNPCNTLTVCQDSTGALTALNATAPYNWQSSAVTQDCSGCLIGCIFPPGCAVNATTWTTYSTNQTAMPPVGVLPIRLIDGNGDTLVITTLAGIPPCANCPTINMDTVSQTPINCIGANNGAATVSASGGSGTYTYVWSPGNLNGASQSNLAPGTYSIIATDGAGCTGQLNVSFTNPSALSSSVTTQSASCNQSNGSGTVTISGGTPGYTYLWAPSGGNSNTANGLAAGPYTVTVTDDANCTIDVPVTISNIDGPQMQIVNQTNPTCFGGNNGSAQISANSGTPPYTYLWTPGNLNGVSQNNLSAGTYTIIATDSIGCTGQLSVSLTNPLALSSNVSSQPATCNQSDGSGTVTVTGGTPGYTYSWAPSGGTGNSAGNLAAGFYTVTVSDTLGCSLDVPVTISNLNGPQLQIVNQTNPTCFGSNNGSAQVSASLGTAPYSYLWSPGNLNGASQSNLSPGTYTILTTDSTGCTGQLSITLTEPLALSSSVTTIPASCNQNNGSGTVTITGGTPGYSYSWAPSGGNGSTANGLAAGPYSVSVTDNAGCTLNVSVAISNVGAPQIQIVSQTNPTCFGMNDGGAQISASLGVTPYTYSWSPSGGNSTIANNLGAGTYTITVTGADNCQVSEIITLTEPAAIQLITGSTPADCGQTNGTAFVTATLGVNPYTYLWQPGAVNTANITSVAAGNYVVTVTDANDCSQLDTVIIGLVVDSTLAAEITTTIESCEGFDGSAAVIASGGLPPYQYSWNGAPISDSTSVFGLTSGNYTLTVYDQCYSKVFSFTINQVLGLPDSTLYNILTPNDDGKNDFYDAGLQFEGTENFECIIYNRWGNVLHKTDNPAILWIPNSNVAAGVYFMIVMYTDCLGNAVKLTGTVTVARN